MLIALLLFAAAFLLAAVSGRSLRHTLPLTVTGAALAVYGCTWLNHKSGAYPLLWLALAVLAVLAVRQARQKRLTLPPAGQALLFLGLILLLWAATRDWVPAFVDDRRHWAVFAAQMVTVERFPTGLQSCSSFADYPPLTGLFQAFLQPGRRMADIGLFYFGQRLFYMVLCLPVLPGWPRGKKRWQKALSALGQAVFVLAAPALFSQYAPYALAPDTMMGFFAAWALITAWRAKETGPDWFAVLEILAVLLALPLCKQTGILFALITALCVTLLLMRRTRWYLTLLWWLAPAASWGSWQLMCRIRGLSSYLTEEAHTAFTLDNLARMVLDPLSWSGTLTGYLRTLAQEPINGSRLGLSALAFTAVLAVLAWQVFRRRPEWRAAGRRTGIVLLVSAVLFAAALCFSYLFLFEPWEREIFSAYARYMSPFFAAGTLWLVYLAVRAGFSVRVPRRGWLAAACLLVLLVTANWTHAAGLLPGVYSQLWGGFQQAHRQTGEWAQTLKTYLQQYDPQEAPIVLVAADSSECANQARCLPYLLAPARVDAVYRDDYAQDDPGGFGGALGSRIEARQYNLFFAEQATADWLPYAGRADDEGKALETGVVYALKNDFLHRETAA